MENIFNPEVASILSFCDTCTDFVSLEVLNCSREQQIWACECPGCACRTLIDRYGYEIISLDPNKPVDRYGYPLQEGDKVVMRMMLNGFDEEFDAYVIEGTVKYFVPFPVDNPLAIFVGVEDESGNTQNLHRDVVMRADLYWSLYLPERFRLPTYSSEINRVILEKSGSDY